MNRYKLIDWGAGLGICLGYMGTFIYIPFLLTKLGREYSGFWAGFILFMTYVGRMSATLCYSELNKKFSMRYIITLSVLIEGLAIFGMALTDSRFIYTGLAFIIGFGSGTSFPSLKQLLTALPEKFRLAAFSRFQLSAQGGSILGAIIGGYWLANTFEVFFLTFLLFLGYAVITYFFIPYEKSETLVNVSSSNHTEAPTVYNNKLQKRTIKVDLFMSMFYWMLIMVFMVDMPLHIQAYLPSVNFSMPFWLTGAILLVFQMPLSRLANKVLSNNATIILGCVILLLGFIFLNVYSSKLCMIAGCVAIALAQIFYAPALDMHIAKHVIKENMSNVMSSMHFYRSLGNMLGAFGAGILFDIGNKTQFYNLPWLIMAIIAFILIINYLIFARIKIYRRNLQIVNA